MDMSTFVGNIAGQDLFRVNLVLAWLWILLSFVSGGLTGMNFKFLDADWLGGYTGTRRRMYRLGHVALFALGTVNLLFYLTFRNLGNTDLTLVWASWGFVIGALTMPTCCYLIAHRPRLKYLFYIPSASLIIAGLLTVWVVFGL